MKEGKVYFIGDNFLENLRKILIKILPEVRNESWVVKFHMGEYGNLNYVRPPIVELIVDILKKKGANPFLFDTPTLYKGQRYYVKDYYRTAWKNGFHPKTMGCSLKITNRGIPIKGRKLGKIVVAEPVYRAVGMVVLSHFKGHPDAGFGGAIKNLGMGGVVRKTKKDLHMFSQPVIDYKKCTVCGNCVKVCPWGGAKIKNRRVNFDYNECFGCGACIFNCPQKALKPKVADLRDLLVEAA